MSPRNANILIIPIEMNSLDSGRRNPPINSQNNLPFNFHKIPPHFRFIFLLTGLYFEGEQRRQWRWIRFGLVFFFIFLNVYRLGTFLAFLFNSANSKVLSAHILVLNIKALTAQILFCYWQSQCLLSILIGLIIGPKLTQKSRRIFWQTLVICLSMFLLQISAEGMNFILKQTGQLDFEDKREAQRKVIKEIGFGAFKHLFFLIVNWWHAQFVMTIIIVFFNVLIRVVICELNELNSVLKMKNLDDAQLVEFCDHFLAIAKKVRRIDRTFGAYLFLMLCTNIPATLFTLIRLFRQFKNFCWLQFAILLPDLFSCIFELVSLTVMPSILHARLLEVPTNLVEQTRVNELLDSHPHNHIRFLVSRITIQSGLGISLWGFTIITKPLMLSVLSAMATYLTIIMQIFTN